MDATFSEVLTVRKSIDPNLEIFMNSIERTLYILWNFEILSFSTKLKKLLLYRRVASLAFCLKVPKSCFQCPISDQLYLNFIYKSTIGRPVEADDYEF